MEPIQRQTIGPLHMDQNRYQSTRHKYRTTVPPCGTNTETDYRTTSHGPEQGTSLQDISIELQYHHVEPIQRQTIGPLHMDQNRYQSTRHKYRTTVPPCGTNTETDYRTTSHGPEQGTSLQDISIESCTTMWNQYRDRL